MLRNYIKIAWRNLRKNKVYSFINLSGLTIGMTSFILIALFVQYEVSFDKHIENAENTYRIISQQHGNVYKGSNLFAGTPLPLGRSMTTDFPEVLADTKSQLNYALLSKGQDVYNQQGIEVDSNFFHVFNIEVLSGEGAEALTSPNSILLTESLSKKIFGTESALGKSLTYERNQTFTVKGILPDVPKNQHFFYDYIIPFDKNGDYAQNLNRWANNCCQTYVQLSDGVSPESINQKLRAYRNYTKVEYNQFGLQTPDFFLQNIKDVHLTTNVNFDPGSHSDIRYIYLFGAVGLIILLLASVNYMNLATVHSAQRAKEVGITKVFGANKKQLISQFLGESFLFTIISFFLAILLVYLLLPSFNNLLDKTIVFDILGEKWLLVSMLSLAILISGLAGLYPAVFLSGLSPTKAFKGNFLKNSNGSSLVRNSFVVGQFVAAITLAIGSVIIYQQLHFVQNKNLGFQKEQIIHVPYYQKDIAEHEEQIRSKLLQHPNIKEISLSAQLPFGFDNQGPLEKWEGKTDEQKLASYRAFVDYDFIDIFDMEIVKGRAFSKEFSTDKEEAYILNQEAVKQLGWDNPIGKSFEEGRVVGVVKDFHIQKFDLAIEPLYLMISPDWARNFGQLILKIDVGDFENTKEHITKTLADVAPLIPFDIRFVDETYNQLYDTEKRLGSTLSLFTFLALFIAAMGLFGIVSHSILQRTKEIGVRKVLGSSVSGIVTLVSKDFLKLVFIAFVLAAPIAYYLMNTWLQDFAYRIDINWWVIGLIGFCAILISFLTISSLSIKAAMVNPVKSLRSE